MKRHVMTAKRKAALRKAQFVSARKRRKKKLNSLDPKGKNPFSGKRLTYRQVRRNRIIATGVLVGAMGITFSGARTASRANRGIL